jgi:hypothetical protein
MLWMRYKAKAAAGFVGTTVGTAAFLALLAAPDAMAQPDSLVQNTVAFPLGLTHHKSPAASPLPGHLLSELGPAGHIAAVALMGVAAVAFAAWLLLRPPLTHQSVAWRLAVGYAGMFVLAPATRFGYFAYPLCLLGWLVLTNYQPRLHTERILATVPPKLSRWWGSRGLPGPGGYGGAHGVSPRESTSVGDASVRQARS